MDKRVVVAMVAISVLTTIYSLNELHNLSVQHVTEDGSAFAAQADHKQSAGVQGGDLPLKSGQTAIRHGTVVRKTASGGKPVIAAGIAGVGASLAGKVGTVRAATAQHLQTRTISNDHSEHKCYVYENTELWGDAVKWGTTHKTDTIGECCDACRNFEPATSEDQGCNVFVWCGDQEKCKDAYRQCWLKHLAHPQASKPAKQGPGVPWTSGTIDVDINADPAARAKGAKVDHEARRFHIVTSAQGAAVHWQARIHYYHYKKQKAACEAAGGCEMGGFTRLLHSGQPDDLMNEIPTVVVDPLPQDMVEHSWYVVLNRPYAFVQWVSRVTIPERYVLMSEPDHIFLRPMPNFMTDDTPAAFPFFYIEPAKKEFLPITRKFTGNVSRRQLEEIAPIGNSPTFMTWDDLSRTMPLWMNTSIAVFKDPQANKAWGWVQEMYGFTIAAWLAGIKRFDLYLHMMAQPPWDMNLEMAPGKPFYILHYTYGMDYKLTGEFTPGKVGEWRFDKRWYGGRPIPRHLQDPPAGMNNDLVRALINAFNEATDAIPCWDLYVPTGKVPKDCLEPPKHFLAEEAARKAKQGGAGGTGTGEAASMAALQQQAALSGGRGAAGGAQGTAQ